jgi:hypothetical protein
MRLKPLGVNGFETAVLRLDDFELRWGFRASEGKDGG